MEQNIDKYSHKLSENNNICYEKARNMIEKSVQKLEDKNLHTNNIVKNAYAFSKEKIQKIQKLQEGGDEEISKKKYLKYKNKYLQLKNNL